MFDAFVQDASVAHILMIALLSGSLFMHLTKQLVEGLFHVGRSDSEVAEIKARYSFWEQLFLEHIIKDSMYEDDFARSMAVFHDIGAALLWAILLLTLPALLLDQLRMAIAWIAIILTLVCFLPMLLLHLILLKFT